MPSLARPEYPVFMPMTAAPVVALPEFVRDGRSDPGLLGRTEWLLTNGEGGFAMGTVSGVPTRRYHGLFIASMRPPVQRDMLVHSIVETVVVAPGTDRERSFNLTPFRFAGGTEPTNPYLVKFTRTPVSCTWHFRIGQGAEQVEVEKSLHLTRGVQGMIASYSIRGGMDMVRLQLRPLLRMQDMHAMMHKPWDEGDFRAEWSQRQVKVHRPWRTLELACDSGCFEAGMQWWYNFAYEHERDRGYDFTEDLWSPGAFQLQLRPATKGAIAIRAWVGGYGESPPELKQSLEASTTRLSAIIDQTCKDVPASERATAAKLVCAADDYVVTRTVEGARATSTDRSIIAGYPWFSDWGRDSMISCCGLLIATGRFEEARGVLATFASHRKNGLIPNLFNDQSGHAEYNTADASLWFLHAACEYLRASEDMEGFETLLKPACLDIIDAYRDGTEFGIRVDPVDGLVMAGDETTQLTWMDAKRDGVAFTPRHGKPVELSALWYSGVLGVASAVKRFQGARAQELERLAKRTADHFRVLFWNAAKSCLHDVLEPGANATWKPVAQMRPNQIFAVSLPRSALEPSQQKSVVAAVKAELLTDRGLRTLAASDPGYKARYWGPMKERDAAYHNGTVWPWLLGPYAEAVMRAGGFTPKSRKEAREALAPLIARMDELCPGHLAEVYDADSTAQEPARPGGCPAQAWSVAETLRVWVMSFREKV